MPDSTDRSPEATSLSFQEWNARFVGHFFNPSQRHRTVRLGIDETTLVDLGGSSTQLAEATRNDAESTNCANIQVLGLKLQREWRATIDRLDDRQDAPPPPYLPVLVLYVLAVNYGGDDHPAHQFYDRLHLLLGEPPNRIGDLKPSWVLWADLEEWSARLRVGSLGVFELGIVGQQPWVGIARRQMLVAPREEPHLRAAFLASGLAPGSNPTDRHLLSALRSAEGLLNRTRRLISQWPTNPASRDLLDEVRNRFEAWDQISSTDAGRGGQLALPLRVVLERRGNDIAGGYFETELVRDATDEDCRLVPVVGDVPECLANRDLWLVSGDASSRPTVVDESNDPEWAPAACWFAPLKLAVEGTIQAVLYRSARSQLVFRRSDRIGLLEEADTADLRAGETYLLLRTTQTRDSTDPDFVDRFLHGSWQNSSFSSDVVHRAFRASARLGEPTQSARLRLVGGIRATPFERSYLHFALPEIAVELSSDQTDCVVTLRCFGAKGRPLTEPISLERLVEADTDDEMAAPSSPSPEVRFRMPAAAEAWSICELELEGLPAARVRFFVERSSPNDEAAEPRPTDGLGLPVQPGSSPIIRGLAVEGDTVEPATGRPMAARPVFDSESPPPDSTARRVMQLMRARRSITWKQARLWLPGCFPKSHAGVLDSRYLVHQVQALHALGVIQLEDEDGGTFGRLLALPPTLVLLPRLANLGLDPTGRRGILTASEAILAGCWLPEEIARLEKAATRARIPLKATRRRQGLELAPHRRCLLVEGDFAIKRLSELARSAQVAFCGATSVSTRLAAATVPIDKLVDRDGWRPGPPSDVFHRRYFDPRGLGVSEEPLDSGDRYELMECRHPNRPLWSHFIIDRESNQSLQIEDRQLARWFVRQRSVPEAPVPVNQDALIVPLELRLPRLLERIACLSSGFAPSLERYRDSTSPFRRSEIRTKFVIPAPPDRPVHWLASKTFCSGNFVCYRGTYETSAWPLGSRMPLLGVRAERIEALWLEGAWQS